MSEIKIADQSPDWWRERAVRAESFLRSQEISMSADILSLYSSTQGGTLVVGGAGTVRLVVQHRQVSSEVPDTQSVSHSRALAARLTCRVWGLRLRSAQSPPHTHTVM